MTSKAALRVAVIMSPSGMDGMDTGCRGFGAVAIGVSVTYRSKTDRGLNGRRQGSARVSGTVESQDSCAGTFGLRRPSHPRGRAVPMGATLGLNCGVGTTVSQQKTV